MLQTILRNRYMFVTCLAFLWCLIFLIPRIGNKYRNYKPDFSHVNINAPKKDVQVMTESHEDEKEDKAQPYVDDELEYLHAGEFQQENLCLDTLDGVIGSQPGLWQCHGEGRNQFWFILKDTLTLKNKDLCIAGPDDLKTPGKVTLQNCNKEETQAWTFENNNLKLSGSSLCISNRDRKVFADQCNDDKSQKWNLKVPPGM